MQRRIGFGIGLLAALAVSLSASAQPAPAATAGFDQYVSAVDARMAEEHASGLPAPVDWAQVRARGVVVDPVTPPGGAALPGALLHDWRATAFVPGATAAGLEAVLRDFSGYPRVFAPQVVATRVAAQRGDAYQVWMRVRQRHVITVTMDATYDVRFGRLDEAHGWSVSRSRDVRAVSADGAQPERALDGALWRLDTWWSWEERNGGLAIEVETVSLTRPVPWGLRWIVGPYVESVPRESLEFTLRAACRAVRLSRPVATEATRVGQP